MQFYSVVHFRMARRSKKTTYPVRLPTDAFAAAERGERSIIERRGHPVAAVVTLDDCELLERIVKRLEDEIDFAAIARSMKHREKGMPWTTFRKKLGLE